MIQMGWVVDKWGRSIYPIYSDCCFYLFQELALIAKILENEMEL